MSLWGKIDRREVSATATANNGSDTVVTSASVVTAANGFQAGYSLVIANVDYRIAKLVSGNTIQLDTTFKGANVATANIALQEDPKWVSTNGWGANVSIGSGANTVNKASVVGVDLNEVNARDNKLKGINHTGWVHYNTYTTTQGSTRNKAETLVAMSKNFNENSGGTLLGDANDDSTVKDYFIYFTTVPSAASNTTGNAVVFTAAPRSSPNGATITIRWEYSTDNTTFVTVPYSANISGNTTNTLTISNVSVIANRYFRANASTVSGGGTSNVTTSAQATVV